MSRLRSGPAGHAGRAGRGLPLAGGRPQHRRGRHGGLRVRRHPGAGAHRARGHPVAATPSPTATPTPSMPTVKPKPAKPAIDKGKVYVEVYNNSGVTGLAGRVGRDRHPGGLEGRRHRQLVRHHPRLDGLLPAPAPAGGPGPGARPRHPSYRPGRRPHEARPAHGHPHLRPRLTASAPLAPSVPGWGRGVHVARGRGAVRRAGRRTPPTSWSASTSTALWRRSSTTPRPRTSTPTPRRCSPTWPAPCARSR